MTESNDHEKKIENKKTNENIKNVNMQLFPMIIFA